MLNVQGVTNQSTSGLAEPCRGNWDPRQLFVPAMDAVDVGPWARLKSPVALTRYCESSKNGTHMKK